MTAANRPSGARWQDDVALDQGNAGRRTRWIGSRSSACSRKAFDAEPLWYGEARVVERDEPFELAGLVRAADAPRSHPDVVCRQGNVEAALERIGVGRHRLLWLLWDDPGSATYECGLDLVGSSRQRYLCWWDEEESYRAVAAISPWNDPAAVSNTVYRVLSCDGAAFGLESFDRLPDETRNASPDLVDRAALEQAYFDAMELWQRERGDAWVGLAEEHFGRVVEPNQLQRSLDGMDLFMESIREWISGERQKARMAESAAFSHEARVRLLDEWFSKTYVWALLHPVIL